VLGVETAPPCEDVVRIAELDGGRRPTVLGEERIGPATKNEVGLVHPSDAIPSRR
jgi:hypothetical protein